MQIAAHAVKAHQRLGFGLRDREVETLLGLGLLKYLRQLPGNGWAEALKFAHASGFEG
jgi:hypothetical protein